MGQDVEYWTEGTAAHWFSNKNVNYPCPITQKNLSPSLSKDSILTLKDNYLRFTESNSEDSSLSQTIISSCTNFSAIYKRENTLRYYLIDPIEHFVRFLFPNRIDDFPFAKMKEAKWQLKLIKGGNYLILITIHAALLIVLFVFLYKRMRVPLVWLSIGLLPAGMLAFMGWVEQRYLVTSHYFFIIAISGASVLLLERFRHARPV